MSLSVSPAIIAAAQTGAMTSSQFISCIKQSLPDAFGIVHDLAHAVADAGPKGFAVFDPPKLDNHIREQLLRMMASTSMREAMEQEFAPCAGGGRFKLAFVNCHKLGGFVLGSEAVDREYEDFTSPENQILSQRPEFVHC